MYGTCNKEFIDKIEDRCYTFILKLGVCSIWTH